MLIFFVTSYEKYVLIALHVQSRRMERDNENSFGNVIAVISNSVRSPFAKRSSFGMNSLMGNKHMHK